MDVAAAAAAEEVTAVFCTTTPPLVRVIEDDVALSLVLDEVDELEDCAFEEELGKVCEEVELKTLVEGVLLVEAFVDEDEDTLPRTAVIFDVLVEDDDELVLLLVLEDFAAVELEDLTVAEELADFTTAEELVFAVDDLVLE